MRHARRLTGRCRRRLGAPGCPPPGWPPSLLRAEADGVSLTLSVEPVAARRAGAGRCVEGETVRVAPRAARHGVGQRAGRRLPGGVDGPAAGGGRRRHRPRRLRREGGGVHRRQPAASGRRRPQRLLHRGAQRRRHPHRGRPAVRFRRQPPAGPGRAVEPGRGLGPSRAAGASLRLPAGERPGGGGAHQRLDARAPARRRWTGRQTPTPPAWRLQGDGSRLWIDRPATG